MGRTKKTPKKKQDKVNQNEKEAGGKKKTPKKTQEDDSFEEEAAIAENAEQDQELQAQADKESVTSGADDIKFSERQKIQMSCLKVQRQKRQCQEDFSYLITEGRIEEAKDVAKAFYRICDELSMIFLTLEDEKSVHHVQDEIFEMEQACKNIRQTPSTGNHGNPVGNHGNTSSASNRVVETCNPVQGAAAHHDVVSQCPSSGNPRSPGPEQSGARSNIDFQLELAEMLAKASLPSIPCIQVFDDDKTVYYTWKGEMKSFIESKLRQPAEKLNYLYKFTKDNSLARSLISSYVKTGTEEALVSAWQKLDFIFGNAEYVSQAHMRKVRSFEPIESKDTCRLLEFSSLLNTILCDLRTIGRSELLDSDEYIKLVLTKLPYDLITRWEQKCAHDFQSDTPTDITFNDVCNFIEKQSLSRSNPRFGRDEILRAKRELESEGHRSEKKSSTSTKEKPLKKKALLTKCDAPSTATKTQGQGSARTKNCEFCNKSNHGVKDCFSLQKIDSKAAKSFMRSHGYCFKCGGTYAANGHQCVPVKCRSCDSKDHLTVFHTADADGGQKHVPRREEYSSSSSDEEKVESKTRPKQGIAKKTSISSTNPIFDWSHIVQVRIFPKDRPNEKRLVYACVDGESNTSFIDERFADECKFRKLDDDMTVHTILSENTQCYQAVDDICMESLDGEAVTYLPRLYCSPEIPASHDNIPSPKDVKKYEHLRGIRKEFPKVNRDIPIVLLIGRNCADAIGYTEIVPYPGNRLPSALKTKYGWSISYCNDPESEQLCCKTMTSHPSSISSAVLSENSRLLLEPSNELEDIEPDHEPDTLTETLIQSIERDFKNEDATGLQKYSREDQRFLDIATESIQLVDGHYTMDLPFKAGRPILPNNREYAVKRLNGQLSKLKKDTEFSKDYCDFFKLMMDNEYVVEVSPDKQSPTEEYGKFWYVPHHGVYHPKKGQLRVVFDVPARFKGESVNLHLLSGPDLNNGIVGCLTRFRKDKVAVACDIRKMFYAVKVNPVDQDYYRLVWFAYKPDGTIDYDQVRDYKMTRHVFGACCSPSCANFALKQAALDNRDDFDEMTFEMINDHFYVDDGCTSVGDTETAVKLCDELMDMCSRGGFHVHKFTSNDKEVIQSLPADRVSVEVNSDIPIPETRVLGIIWNPEKDIFRFTFDRLDKPFTRAGILSAIHSIYDPLGFLAPVILEGRLLSQSLCYVKTEDGLCLGWNEIVPPDVATKFFKWVRSLAALTSLEIPRCLIPSSFGDVVVAELHHFGDASEQGYGCCTYLRTKDREGQTYVSFVGGKSKVCPVKPVSIPRKELVSAKLNVELSLQLNRELRNDSLLSHYPEFQNFYYTDSKIVLAYIQNDSVPLKMFCANRANFIVQNTEKTNWFHVSGEQNPADYASRGIKAQNLTMDHPYLRGPDFLWSPDYVPAYVCEPATDFQIERLDPEIKETPSTKNKKICNAIHAEKYETAIHVMSVLERCSSLEVAKRRLGLVLKFIEKLKSKVSQNSQIQTRSRTSSQPKVDEPLAELLDRSMMKMIQQLQRAVYPEIFKRIAKRLSNEDTATQNELLVQCKDSKLQELSPFYDRDLGLLRVGGRLEASSTHSLIERHPIILPKSHHVTSLVIDFYHRKLRHQGFAATTNAIRQAGLYIVSFSSQVKRFLKSCVICRRLRSGELTQRMAPLPVERTQTGLFTYVGADVFGPFEVQVKRSKVKRYGLIFVCFASRAIHIEKLTDLTTDRFLNALRRFICRRGNVKQIWCDRGTNFVGAANEIRTALNQLDEGVIKTFLAQQYGTEYFRFGFPYSSHKNGHVERLIRSVRSVLNCILFEHKDKIDDDILETFFVECECVVNSRPLSVVGLSDHDSVPISPMTILTQKSTVVYSLPSGPRDFDRNDLFVRKVYKRAQFLANAFWKMWKDQYLLQLQKRDKWFSEKRSIQVGDIVLLVEDGVHRNSWPMARVTKVVKDRDGLVRKGVVLKNGQTYDRPISKMIMLVPVEEQ